MAITAKRASKLTVRLNRRNVSRRFKKRADGRRIVARARRIQLFLSQPFFVAEQFTGIPGKYTPRDETIASFRALCDGEYDHLPEQAFLLVGGVEEAVEAAKKMEQAA